MRLTGLHLLLTYTCNYRCDHCFVWGSPWQGGVMTLADIERILDQAVKSDISSVYFEGGEPFLYYSVLVRAVEMASTRGLTAGVVTNAYWATAVEDAAEWLRPLAGRIRSLSVSSDVFHGSDAGSDVLAAAAETAAAELGISCGVISIAGPDVAEGVRGQLPEGHSAVMYRGRAALRLAPKACGQPWQSFTSCPHEDLEDPGRVHVDPYGNLHVCQGISIGNMLKKPLADICAAFRPAGDPVMGALLAGGPVELAAREGITPQAKYADACHFCYELRLQLREKYPATLCPDQMYGEPGEE